MFCIECGAANPGRAKFCNTCGKSLEYSPHPSVLDGTEGVGQVSPEGLHTRPKGGTYLWIAFVAAIVLVVGIIISRHSAESGAGVSSGANARGTVPGDSDERVAPSRGHLEWEEREYERYKARLSQVRESQRFARSDALIDRFLKDADSLHSKGREAYEQALSGPRDRAMGISFIYGNAFVHLEAIVVDARYMDDALTSGWKPNCVSRDQKSLSDLTKSDGELTQLAAVPQNQEMVRQLRRWSAASQSILDDVYGYAQANDKFNALVSLEHGQMLQEYVALRLAYYYSMDRGPLPVDRAEPAGQPSQRPEGIDTNESALGSDEARPPTPGAVGVATKLTLDVLSNMTYRLSDKGTPTIVRLIRSKGHNEQGEFRLDTEHFALGDLGGDGVDDAIAVLVSSGSGSGAFYYLVAVMQRKGALETPAVKRLGDRIKINEISIRDGIVTVDMITQGPKDPMCCPTERQVLKLIIQENNFVSVH